jgi:hypothetical protein
VKFDPVRKRAVVILPIIILQPGLAVEGLSGIRHSVVLAFTSAREVVLDDFGTLDVAVGRRRAFCVVDPSSGVPRDVQSGFLSLKEARNLHSYFFFLLSFSFAIPNFIDNNVEPESRVVRPSNVLACPHLLGTINIFVVSGFWFRQKRLPTLRGNGCLSYSMASASESHITNKAIRETLPGN